jgi:hypothetical protein
LLRRCTIDVCAWAGTGCEETGLLEFTEADDDGGALRFFDGGAEPLECPFEADGGVGAAELCSLVLVLL